jgi:hypothetical protein
MTADTLGPVLIAIFIVFAALTAFLSLRSSR